MPVGTHGMNIAPDADVSAKQQAATSCTDGRKSKLSADERIQRIRERNRAAQARFRHKLKVPSTCCLLHCSPGALSSPVDSRSHTNLLKNAAFFQFDLVVDCPLLHVRST